MLCREAQFALSCVVHQAPRQGQRTNDADRLAAADLHGRALQDGLLAERLGHAVQLDQHVPLRRGRARAVAAPGLDVAADAARATSGVLCQRWRRVRGPLRSNRRGKICDGMYSESARRSAFISCRLDWCSCSVQGDGPKVDTGTNLDQAGVGRDSDSRRRPVPLCGLPLPPSADLLVRVLRRAGPAVAPCASPAVTTAPLPALRTHSATDLMCSSAGGPMRG